MSTSNESGKPWWREPWPWILMAGPFAAMVACIMTIVLAVRGFDAQTIADGGRRQGLVVSKPVDPGAPARARAITPGELREGT